MSTMSSSILLLLSILAVASTSDECKRSFILSENYKIDKTLSISFPFRFCPEDIKAAVFRPMVREVVKKKNWEKAVRLTTWVDPPSPEAVRKM